MRFGVSRSRFAVSRFGISRSGFPVHIFAFGVRGFEVRCLEVRCFEDHGLHVRAFEVRCLQVRDFGFVGCGVSRFGVFLCSRGSGFSVSGFQVRVLGLLGFDIRGLAFGVYRFAVWRFEVRGL